MGIGTIVIGLAAVIVGESILPSRKLVLATLAVIIGAIVYRFFIALALNSDFIGLKAQDLNLVTAVLVTIALVIPMLRKTEVEMAHPEALRASSGAPLRTGKAGSAAPIGRRPGFLWRGCCANAEWRIEECCPLKI